MHTSPCFLSPSEAALRLGITVKALRLYEQRGLLAPSRNAAGWRCYGAADMARGADIVAWRALGLSLAQIGHVLQGQTDALQPALAVHEASLQAQARQLDSALAQVRRLRADLLRGQAPAAGALSQLTGAGAPPAIAFELPWPWGSERFMLRRLQPLHYIVGPLGSGKTRLAQRLAERLPDAAFLGLERVHDGLAAARLQADPGLQQRVDQALAWLVEEGATVSEALVALLAALQAEAPAVLVVDLVEEGLDEATQQAVAAHLRQRGPGARPVFLLTRSSVMLDLAAVGADTAIILCPANHSPPTLVAPYPGSPGYEAVASCLATPAVRARTHGVIAWRPPAAGAAH